MSASALIASERLYLTSMLQRMPATLTLGTRTLRAAKLEKRGTRFEQHGGQIQQKTLHLIIPCAELPDAEIIDPTTDATRAVRLTHLQTGRVYQLDTETPPQKSPQGIYWSLTAIQTART